jgi:predicted transcriptional regulator
MIELYKLSVQLNNLEDEMTEIKELIKQSEYDNRMTALEPVINNIKNIQDEIIHYLAYDKYDEAIEKQIHSDIHDYMMKYKFNIYQQLVGTYGKVPLLKIWSSVVSGRHRFLSKEDSAKVQEMFDCFMKIQEAELYLLVEYYHTQASYTTQDIVNLINEFCSNIEEEQNLLLPSIPENVLIDREQNIMIYGGYYYYYNAWGKIKIRKIQGPWRGDFEDKDEAINKMCYSMSYNNWRALTYDEFMNMFTDNDLNPYSIAYLQDEGWVTPPLKDGMELVLDSFMFSEIIHLGNSNSTRDSELLTDIYENSYYWLTVRSMDKNEMSQYFWK